MLVYREKDQGVDRRGRIGDMWTGPTEHVRNVDAFVLRCAEWDVDPFQNKPFSILAHLIKSSFMDSGPCLFGGPRRQPTSYIGRAGPVFREGKGRMQRDHAPVSKPRRKATLPFKRLLTLLKDA